MRKIKKINGFLVVKFNDREKREYEGTALGEYGVIDAEAYTGNLDIDRGAMEYDDADTLEVAVELARGLESEEDITDEPPTYTAAVETNESYTEEAVEPAALIEGWTRRLATQVKSKHYPDTDPRTAAHELYGFKMALHQIGFLPESEVITDPDTFGAGRLDGPMPRNPEELLAFVCDERCKNRAGHTQEELDAICAKCPLGQLYEDAEAQDLRIRERSERALREHIESIKEATVETKELYYPQISAQAGSYTFEEGVELEIYSSKSSYYDWAKIRFTSQFRPKLSLKKKDPATIQLGYDGTLEDVFTGFVSGNYDGGTYANEVALKDEMLLMEETIINDTFLDTTPQELISYFLAQAGLSKMKLSSKTYPTRKMLPIRRQTAVQAINAVNAAWGLRVPFFFSGGVFYWDEKPEQKKVYTFERGVNILNLRRAGGVWELETVSAPFIKHSHKINLIHPQVSGEVEVSKVVSKTNDSGFIRTYIYF